MIQYITYTNKGDRPQNEDACTCRCENTKGCFVLADGLGGHAMGQEASKLAVEQAIHEYGNGVEELETIVDRCQAKILEAQQQANCVDQMKTTLVLLKIDNRHAQWIHVGDSRLYFFRKGKLVVRTSDHSVPQKLFEMGEIREEEIRHHEQRNQLLRVLGTSWDKPRYEVSKKIRIKKRCRDAFLLCSDGFWEYITEEQMEQQLKMAQSVQEWLDCMLDIIQNQEPNGNRDNFTAIAVWCTDKEKSKK